jgi:hypothetical protein
MQNNNFNNVALIYLACPSKRNLMFFFFFCPHKQHNFMFFSFFSHKVEYKVHVHDIFLIISYKPFLYSLFGFREFSIPHVWIVLFCVP